MNKIQLVVFDLDGTLLDTAKDFLFAVNKLRSIYKLPPCKFEEIRHRVSEGADSLTKYALGLENKEKNKIDLHKKELLKIYMKCCLKNTTLFEGVSNVLEEINSKGIAWGIVTNKPEKFSKKIVSHFLANYKPKFLICPEHVGERKPSPKGLLRGCEIVSANPKSSVYVGDHAIDIEAGKKAKMITVAAAYGYIPKNEYASDWGSEFIVESPLEIKSILSNYKN